MKKLILVRHAKVDIANNQKIQSMSMQNWVKEYDLADLDTSSLPSQNLIQIAQKADIVVSSSLVRTINSTKLLKVVPAEKNHIFNEALVPNADIPFFKLKPKSWLVVLRFLLMFGFGKKDTSLQASKQQAKKAMLKLLELSKNHDTTLLVGHGGMNFLIRKELIKEGWSILEKPSNRHWGTTILTLQN